MLGKRGSQIRMGTFTGITPSVPSPLRGEGYGEGGDAGESALHQRVTSRLGT